MALLRGINVGGRNRLPMKDLRVLLEQVGARGVRTYLQSGNAVFDAAETDGNAVGARLAAAIESAHGFRPLVLVLDGSELERAAAANPFAAAEAAPTSLHLFFPTRAVEQPDLSPLDEVQRVSEAYELRGNVLYLHAPEGLGRSKLAERIDRALGVPTTARNWRTVSNLLTLLRERTATSRS